MNERIQRCWIIGGFLEGHSLPGRLHQWVAFDIVVNQLFRHQLLTYLTSKGILDTKIQRISFGREFWNQQKKMTGNRITVLRASLIFLAFTAYLFLLLFTLFPFMKSNFQINSALYWFITGYFLFIPIFVLAIIMAKIEGNDGMKQIAQALNIRPFSKKDWLYSTIGSLLVFVLTGLIFAVSLLLNKYSGVKLISTTPWFMEMRPFQGLEKLLMLIWLPMFFFNIAGEEMLWRGYIQARLQGKYSWLLCSFLWLVFHSPFGIDLMIMLIPAIIIIPYAFYKTRNTLVGIFIHGIYNGPLFVLVASGLIK